MSVVPPAIAWVNDWVEMLEELLQAREFDTRLSEVELGDEVVAMIAAELVVAGGGNARWMAPAFVPSAGA